MFEPLRNIAKFFISLDVDKIAFEIAKTGVHSVLVIQLNTAGKPTSQLYEKGEDSKGKKLADIGGEYSPLTKDIKQAKGQPIDRVTLRDTGQFYMSFTVTPFRGGFTIDANPIKDETNLFKEWGEDIVGLNDENLQILIDYYKDEFLEKIRKKLT